MGVTALGVLALAGVGLFSKVIAKKKGDALASGDCTCGVLLSPFLGEIHDPFDPSITTRRTKLAVRRLEDRSLPSSVQGTVFDDVNRNQVFDSGECRSLRLDCLLGHQRQHHY